MHTVPELVRLVGLSTENQVRNRIEAIRDLLAGAIRRGPNNQILLTEGGLSRLRDLQSLCESGHTLAEAAEIIRYQAERNEVSFGGATARTRTNPDETGWQALVEHLAADVRRLEERIAAVEATLQEERRQAGWWEQWR